MNADIKTRWVAALRSGGYKQGRVCLRTKDDKYCCLGVLCDILKDQVALGWHLNKQGDWDFGTEGDGMVPSQEIGALADFGERSPHTWPDKWTTNPDLKIEGRFDSAGHHNDKGATFAQIADAIEARL